MTETRSVYILSTGAKVCLLLAAMACVLAAYFYWVPITVLSSSGGTFGCQSAANPPTEDFPMNVCGDLNSVNQTRALMLMLSAALLAGLGSWLFGVERRSESRKRERPADGADEPAGT